jgi:GMP synthase-like glutamine amidotransferase
MKPVLFVRNDAFETFGIARDAFAAAAVPFTVFEAIEPQAPRPSLEDVGGVVMFGSAYNVDETDAHPFLKEIRDLTRETVERGLPYLGICLGAQVLARALDQPVPLAPVKEVGFEPVRPSAASSDDPVTAHYRDGDMMFQWHQDTFALPPGAAVLFTGDQVPLQGFRAGETAWGLQFHFEIDRDEIELWLETYAGEGDLLADWGKSPSQVRAEARLYLAQAEARGAETFPRFAEVVRSRA